MMDEYRLDLNLPRRKATYVIEHNSYKINKSKIKNKYLTLLETILLDSIPNADEYSEIEAWKDPTDIIGSILTGDIWTIRQYRRASSWKHIYFHSYCLSTLMDFNSDPLIEILPIHDSLIICYNQNKKWGRTPRSYVKDDRCWVSQESCDFASANSELWTLQWTLSDDAQDGYIAAGRWMDIVEYLIKKKNTQVQIESMK